MGTGIGILNFNLPRLIQLIGQGRIRISPPMKSKTISQSVVQQEVKMHKTKAFTILEILIVVIVLGVLAALAIPRYIDIVEKNCSNEAMHIFTVVKKAQDVYYSQYGTYASSITALENVSVPTIDGTDTYFYLSNLTGGTAGYTVTLIRTTKGTGAQAGKTITMTYTHNTFATTFGGDYPYKPGGVAVPDGSEPGPSPFL